MLSGTLLGLILVALFAFVFFDVVTIGFGRLGISPWATLLILIASFLGSRVNIPVWQSNHLVAPALRRTVHGFIYYRPPDVTNQVVAINIGGAVIPILISLWLLPRAPLLRTLLATAVVAIVSHQAATIVPGRGVTMQLWIAPLLAALLALLLTLGRGAAPLAYIAGTLGTLIGADLWNIGRLNALGSGVLSIGGAGVFDGVFLAGVVAALISIDRRPRRPKYTRPQVSP